MSQGSHSAVIANDTTLITTRGTTPMSLGIPAALSDVTLRARIVIGIALAVLVLLALSPVALAAPGRAYQSSFGSFANPSATTVDQADGDVYVVDPAAGTVSRFTAAGLPDNFTTGADAGTNTLTGFSFDGPSAVQVAIAPAGALGGTSGDIYVASLGGIGIYSNSGTSLGQITQAAGATFGEACGVATDSAGKLYVGDFGGSVDRFVPSANPATNGDYDNQISGINSPCNVAADSTGAVYASTWPTGPLTKYVATDFGTANAGTQIDAASNAVAVDPSNDDVYVDEGNQISVFDVDGNALYSFGSAADFGTISTGVAVQGSNGQAYVADTDAAQIDVFGPATGVPPTLKTEPATNVHHTSAVLNGHFDPRTDPGITACHFEWGPTVAYGNTAPCAQGNDFTAAADVTATLGNLTPGQTYHFRLEISTTSNGDLQGADQTIALAPFPVTHPFITSFGADGTAPSTFVDNDQIAFDQNGRKLYVINRHNPTGIYGFDASGPPSYSVLPGFASLSTVLPNSYPALAVDNTALPSAGNLFFASDNPAPGINFGTYGFDPDGAPLPGFPVTSSTETCGTAVDSAGDVWVANYGGANILEYNSAGAFQRSVDTSAQGRVCNVAFDSNDDLYASTFSGSTYRYVAVGGYITPPTLVDPGASDDEAIAVDPATHVLYAAHSSSVDEYDSSGGLISHFATDIDSSHFRGVAVDATNHDVYVSDAGNHKILVFGPAIVQELPAVATGSAGAITPNAATLNATVDPETFAVTDCHFEYGSTTSYGQTAPCAPAPGSGSGDRAVSAALSNLDLGTGYHFRIVASNAHGTAFGADDAFTTRTAVKDLATLPATDITQVSATLNGTLDPDGGALTDCHFSYATEDQFQGHGFVGAASAPCEPDPGSGAGAIAVSAGRTGLEPGTTYRFRLQAANAFGITAGQTLTFITGGPQISDQKADKISTVDARLNATVNPTGASTTVHFDYGTTTSYGQSTPESSPIGPDAAVTLSRPVSALRPGTTYHFRAVATNGNAVSHGPDVTFTTHATDPAFASCPNDTMRAGAGTSLPDCRAYEQATPVDKGGTDAQGYPGLTQGSVNGDAVAFFAHGGIPGLQGEQEFPLFVSRRGDDDWSTIGLNPPASQGNRYEPAGWTPDLAHSFTTASSFRAPEGRGPAFLDQDTATNTFTPVHAHTAGTANDGSVLAGASADGSKVYFQDRSVQFTPGAAAGRDNLYVWDRASGAISLAGVLPDSACGSPPCASPTGSFAGPWFWFAESPQRDRGGASDDYLVQHEHAISADGDKVFFTTPDTTQLYLRKDAAGPDASTVQISASHASSPDPNGPQPATFQYATPSGSRVFFTSCERLTDNSTAHSTGPDNCDPNASGQDLYRYDTTNDSLIDLTPGISEPKGADVRGVVGISDDGSSVYFAADADLDGADGPATHGSCDLGSAVGANNCDLYRWHSGIITFVSRLHSDPSAATNWSPGGPTVFSFPAADLNGDVSADGQTVTFSSDKRITSFDNHSGTCGGRGGFNDDAHPPQPGDCREFYRWNADDGLTCLTCDPTGAPPFRAPYLHAIVADGASLNFHNPIIGRNLSADGNRFFFESPDRLVAADTNGEASCLELTYSVPACLDVYEWEAPGSGSCTVAGPGYSTQDHGCIYLLSNGRSTSPSYLADISASGDDAFIFTRDRLVPRDQDGLVDIYDARVGGGFASQRASVSPECSVGTCQGGSATAPVSLAVGTVTFAGAGSAPGRQPVRSVGRVSVSKKAVKGSSFVLAVKVPAAGTVRASGGSIRSVTRTAKKAGSLGLRIRLSAKAKSTLKKKKRLVVKLKVTFKPTSGSTSTASVSLTVKA